MFNLWSLLPPKPVVLRTVLVMSGQKSIVNFFKPLVKRGLPKDVCESPPSKKVKVSEDVNGSEKVSAIPVENKTPDAKGKQKELNFISQDNYQDEINEIRKTLPIVDKNIGHSWFRFLKNEFKKPYFVKLNSFVTKERAQNVVYPPEDKVWSWTQACPVEKVKVVILGQDPYHNPGQAHGLCFSVQSGVHPPPSLLNMYKELQKDITGFVPPKHGHLIGWARQGVLLLNAVLTVRKNSPNSHKDQGWEELTTAVIKYLNERNKGIVFLLWGSYAQQKASFVDKKKHHLLKTVHPSPLSAMRGFFGCKHFSKCNELLVAQGKKPIDWGDLPEQ